MSQTTGTFRPARLFPGLFLILAFSPVACGDGGDEPAGPAGEGDVAAVAVTPDSARLTALDDTLRLSARAADEEGRDVSGVSFEWTSTDPAVATVDASGLVTAVAPGRARAVAEAGGATDTATVVVEQVPTEVEVAPESVRVGVEDTIRFTARATDANDHPVSGATVRWSSSNPAVLTVDEAGVARSLSAGEVTVTAASGEGEGTAAATVTPFGARAQDAVNALLDSVEVAAGASVPFVGPVPGGTIIREEVDPSIRPPTELEVPGGDGTYFVFLIDETPPGTLWGHPVRYAWVDAASGATAVAEARWTMDLQLPEGGARPFVATDSTDVEGIRFLSGDGHFTPDTTRTTDKPSAASLPAVAPDRGGPGDARDPYQSAPARQEGDFGGCRDCSKKALVIDVGDSGGDADDHNFRRSFSDQADEVGRWLDEDLGYDVQRISQDSATEHAAFQEDNAQELEEAFLDKIQNAADALSEEQCPEGKCHSLFIYINGHGGMNGPDDPTRTHDNWIYLDHPTGRTTAYIDYDTFFDELTFPDDVKLTIYFGGCFSGGAIRAAERQAFLCLDDDCGRTILTATDDLTTSTLSENESFADMNRDHDDDGVAGDVRDRWLQIAGEDFDVEVKEGLGGGAQDRLILKSERDGGPWAWICPRDAQSWCCADGLGDNFRGEGAGAPRRGRARTGSGPLVPPGYRSGTGSDRQRRPPLGSIGDLVAVDEQIEVQAPD